MTEPSPENEEAKWGEDSLERQLNDEEDWVVRRKRIFMLVGCLLYAAIFYGFLVTYSGTIDFVRRDPYAGHLIWITYLPIAVLLFFWPVPSGTPTHRKILQRIGISLMFILATQLVTFISGFVTYNFLVQSLAPHDSGKCFGLATFNIFCDIYQIFKSG